MATTVGFKTAISNKNGLQLKDLNDPDMVDAFIAENSSLIDELYEHFRYQGFNPIEFAKVLKDAGFLIGDIQEMIIFLLLRGSKVGQTHDRIAVVDSKAVTKTTDVGKQQLSKWRAKGVVDTGAGAAKLTPKSITLTRIGATYVYMLAAMQRELLIKGEWFPTVYVPDLPIEYQFPGAPAIIPKNQAVFEAAWKRWSKLFSEKIGATDRTDQFWKIMHNSTYNSDQSRMKFLTKISDQARTAETNRRLVELGLLEAPKKP